ncbi:MAG: ferrochelatase [bacterium]|nr:ferrochelatase [bacterium]
MAKARGSLAGRIDTYPTPRLDPARRTGLVLCGMGGPDGPDAVEPFLRNLFRDPQIFPVPPLLAPVLGWAIAKRRSPGVRERYRVVSPDSVTPQLATTRRQGELLAQRLRTGGLDVVPDIAMRYWRPYPDQAVAQLLAAGATQFVVVPMYPQFSAATNGSTLDYVLASLRRLAPEAPAHVMADWHLLDGFLAALATPAGAQLKAWADEGTVAAESALVYVAHSLPYSFIRRGDCYEERTQETVAAVHARVTASLQRAGHGNWQAALMAGGRAPLVTYQSRVGPVKWLEPNIEAETRRLAAAGCRRLFVQPVSFTCEHIETLLELDLELKETAAHAGLRTFARGAALNEDAAWLDSLAARLRSVAFTGGGGGA